MKLTPERLTAFCAVLSDTCNVGKACKAIDISRMTAYNWRKDMPEFAAAWDDAMKAGVTGLEDEAHRRGFEGIDEPLTHQGRFTHLERIVRDKDGNPVHNEDGSVKMEPVLDENGEPQVAAVRKYSDTLAIFLLKAHDPDKYRENSKIDLTARVAVGDMSEDEIRDELATLIGAGVLPVAGGDDDVSDLV